MATSLASSPTEKTPLSAEKRVTFSKEQPEVIPQPSKRRQSSVNQRPSWSNVFLLRDSKVRDDVAARSRSLSPGPSILKEISAFKSDVTDAELKQDEHGVERKVHISPLWEKNLKRLPRGRQKTNALPIPQAKVSRNASPRALSPEDASPRDVSPTSLSARHASPREDTFDKSASEHHSIVVHPPSPPESEDDEDEDVIEEESDESPRHSRTSSIEEVEATHNRFGNMKIDIDGSSHAHRHEKRKDSGDSLKDSQGSRKASQDWRESRKSSYGSRRGSQASRKDSDQSEKDADRPPPPRRRSSSADQAEMWLRKSSIYGVRSKAPRVPTRLGSLRA